MFTRNCNNTMFYEQINLTIFNKCVDISENINEQYELTAK